MNIVIMEYKGQFSTRTISRLRYVASQTFRDSKKVIEDAQWGNARIRQNPPKRLATCRRLSVTRCGVNWP